MVQETIGFIGTGLMGAAMAERLLDCDFGLVVHNRTPEKTEPLRRRGARVAASPAEVAAAADWIGLMLTDGRAVESILGQTDGLLSALGEGKTVANFSTVGPEAARVLARTVREGGAEYIDCPVLGSIAPARQGKLLVFASGDPTVIARSRLILESLSSAVFELGPVGQASGLKLIANMLLARYVEALGEVLALSRGFHLDPKTVLQVIQASALASPMWDKGPTLLEGPAPLHFPLSHMTKDLRLLDEEVERLGLCLPAHEAVYERYQEAELLGLGGFDYSDLARTFEAETSGCDESVD